MQIGSSNDFEAVKAQYAVPKGLDTRLTFHEKYSVNKQGYGEWLVSHYNFRDGINVLEIGSGTGSIWIGHENILSVCGKYIFTDLSEGLLETAKKNIGEHDNIEYRIAESICLSRSISIFPSGSPPVIRLAFQRFSASMTIMWSK